MENIQDPQIPKLLDVASGIIMKPIMDYTKDDQQVLAQQYMTIGFEKAKEKYLKTAIVQERDDFKKTQKLVLRAEMETTTNSKGEEKMKNKYTEDEAKNVVDTYEKTIDYNNKISYKEFCIDTMDAVMTTIQMIQPIARETIGTTGFGQ